MSMRQVLLSDAVHLAVALVHHPLGVRATVLDRWVDQTLAAAKYRRQFDRPHPLWGDGSLTARALRATPQTLGPQVRDGAEFLTALAQVARRLARIGQIPSQPLS